MNTTSKLYLDALLQHYQAEVSKAKANLVNLITTPVGIGEHTDLLADMIEWTDKLAAAEDAIGCLERNFVFPEEEEETTDEED